MARILTLMLLAAAALAPGLLAAAPLPAVSSSGKGLQTDTRTGHYTALHFFASPAGATAHAAILQREAPTLAGVRHAIITKDRVTGPPFLFQDAEGKTAAQFDVSGSDPVTVLLDSRGNEEFRRTAQGGLPFDTLAGLVRVASRNSALAEYNLPKSRVALGGRDPVSYIRQNNAVKGDSAIRSEYRGATYHFATEDNRALFAESPRKYEPAYGGWCATAMANGEKVEVDLENFKVADGRLFLFYKGIWGNAIDEWNDNEARLKPKADKEWKGITGQ